MDKKHNNLAQPETELMINKTTGKNTDAINPVDHPGIKLSNNESKTEQK